MKITKLITVETETEVSVSVEDINQAIREDPERLHDVLTGINNCAQYLKAIPETVLADMTESQKSTIAKFLNDQAHRFMPNESSQATASGGEASKPK